MTTRADLATGAVSTLRVVAISAALTVATLLIWVAIMLAAGVPPAAPLDAPAPMPRVPLPL